MGAALALAGALFVNWMAQSLPLGGRTTGELSALYPNAVVPVGATFTIWGVIYLGLVAWAVVQFLPSAARLGSRIAALFALTSVWNAGWLVAWHYLLPGLSVVIMVTLLATLVLLHGRLETVEAEVGVGAGMQDASVAGGARTPRGPFLLVHGAFGLYLGWILVATVVNITAWLVSLGWEGWGLSDVTWGALVVPVGVGVGALVQRWFRNPAIGVAAAWGFLGTAAAGAGLGEGANAAGSEPGLPPVAVVAALGALLLLAHGAWILLERGRHTSR
jgi:translocator protein